MERRDRWAAEPSDLDWLRELPPMEQRARRRGPVSGWARFRAWVSNLLG